MTEAIVELHDAMSAAQIPHAFGGAPVLARCTRDPRGANDVEVLQHDGQHRLDWDGTPVDLFFNTTEFHNAVATRVVTRRFLDRDMPFLRAADLVVFKALFNRPKDWVDIVEVVAWEGFDDAAVLGVLVHYLGLDDERVAAMRKILTSSPPDRYEPNLRGIIPGN